MKRRTLVKQLGTASVVAAGFSGSAAAALPHTELDVERTVDVSDVEGVVSVEELLDEEDLAQIGDEVDPSEVKYQISPAAETLDVGTECHTYSWFCTTCCGGSCFCTTCCCSSNCSPV